MNENMETIVNQQKKWFKSFLVTRRRKRLRRRVSDALDIILTERHGFYDTSEFRPELNDCLTTLEDAICMINITIEADTNKQDITG